MQLHDLKRKSPRKYAQPRVGRGGKRGYSSGRGQKGQKSRSGHRIRPAERDLIIRLPKLRGYNHKPQKPAAQVVNLSDLGRVTGDVVNAATLHAARLVRNPKGTIKILGDGEVKRALTVSKLKVSAGAKKKIEAAGGKVTS